MAKDGQGEETAYTTVVEKMPPRRAFFRLFLMMIICFVFFVVSLILVAAGVWATPYGRQVLQKLAVQNMGRLIAVPLAERTARWKVEKVLHELTLAIPGFIVGFGGDRGAMYAAFEEVSMDHPIGFRDSFAVFSHKAVSGVLTSTDQPRGVYIGASPVPHKCMGNDTLIFLGTGTEHTQIREFLLANIPTWKQMDPVNGPPLDIDFGEDEELVNSFRSEDGTCRGMPPDTDMDSLVLRALVRTMFKTMFETPITPEALDAFVAYSKWGGTCALGTPLHKLTGGLLLAKVDPLRKQIREAILQTPVGARVKAAAAAAAEAGTLPNRNAEDASGDAIIRQLADGSAFAGMLGTFHLTSHALHRLKSNPQAYLPMWEQDPVAFLHEEARVDPPVTSVTGVLGHDETFDIVEQGDVLFHKGTPFQMVISTANVDPTIFGGKHASKKYANTFDPMRAHGETLSWNGRLEDVQNFKAPRGCPGYRLSMSLAKSMVGTLRPAPEALPKPLPPGSTAARSHPALDPAQEAGLWTSKESTYHVSIDPQTGYKLGCGLWLVCCLLSAGWLLGQGLGAISVRYLQYLGAQAMVSTGVIIDWPGTVVQGMLLGGLAYYLMYITAVSQKHRVRGHVLSLWAWFVWSLLASSLGLVSFMFGEVTTLSTVAMVFYSVGALLAVLTIWRFFLIAREENSIHGTSVSMARYDAAKYGVLGAFFGVTNLAWALIPGWGLFVSRLLDSLLYVPLMLGCIKAMDCDFLDTDVALPNRRCMRVSMMLFAVFFVVVAFVTTYSLSAALTSDLCVWEKPPPADKSVCVNTPMSRVDAYGRVMFTAVKSMVTITDEEVKKFQDPKLIQLPKYASILQQKEAIVSTGWNIPIQDEDTEEESMVFKLIKYILVDIVLRSSTLFPIHDNPERWGNLAQANSIMKIAGGSFLPEPVMDWTGIDKTSDEAISAMCFAGMAAPRLVLIAENASPDPDNAKFVADFSEMRALDTRPGYERFGATAFFDGAQKLVRIRWSEHGMDVRPGDRHWKHAKWVFKCSALVGITAMEHLMTNHLVFANMVTSADRQNLPKNHPIRRLLKPFTHGTPTVNLGAQLFLTTENGLLHRAVSLTFDGVRDALLTGLASSRVVGKPMDKHADVLGMVGDLDFPYAADGRDFYEVVHKFVDSYFRVYYRSDEELRADRDLARFYAAIRVFKDTSLPSWEQVTLAHMTHQAAYFVFTVAGNHHVVGNVAEYIVHPDFASTRIRPGSEVADVEGSHYGMLVAILTGMKAPKLMSDFSHLLLQDKHIIETHKIFDDFQADLAALGKTVDERNAKRKWKFNGFHPARLLSSVSI